LRFLFMTLRQCPAVHQPQPSTCRMLAERLVAAMKTKIVIGLLLLVIGALGVGAYILHNMMQRGFNTRAEPMQMEKALATTIRVQALPSRYKAIKNPITTTPEEIHEGMAHLADHWTACHANNGSGDTLYGKAMYPRRQTCARRTRRSFPTENSTTPSREGQSVSHAFRIRGQFRLTSDQPLQRTSVYRQPRDRAAPGPRSVRPSACQFFVLCCMFE